MFSKPKMAHNKPVPKLSQRIAEEAQLLAEEKWIIGALKKIKAQRNGLQIERLHLENMRAKLLATVGKKPPGSSGLTEPLPEVPPITFDCSHLFPPDMEDEEVCNTEELNLSVTNSVFNTEPYGQVGDEEEDEDDNMDNCVLDIDLLMSSK